MSPNSQVALPPILLGLAVLLVGALAMLSAASEWISDQLAVGVLSVLLIAYISMEIRRLRRVHPFRWLVNPVVVSSAVTFVMGFGVTNIVSWLPEETALDVGVLPTFTPAMTKLMLLVLLGAVSMWLGYWSLWGGGISRVFGGSAFFSRIVRKDFKPRAGVVLGLVVLSIASRVIELRLGVFGYAPDELQYEATSNIRQYVAMMSAAGQIALALVALQFFGSSRTPETGTWLISILIYEIAIGFLSGFKGAAVTPIVVVGLCQYMQTGQIPRRLIALFVVILFVAYAIIGPFRATLSDDKNVRGAGLNEIASILIGIAARSSEDQADEEGAGTISRILARTNQTYIGSLGIQFADSEPLPAGSPSFLMDIVLAPAYAFVPRALWGGKTEAKHGNWYYNEIMGVSGVTSVGMSPFTYLYFAGGVLAVIVGFFIIGVLQRSTAERLLFPGRAGGLFVMLAVFSIFANIDSIFYSVFVSLLRQVPLMLAVQYVALHR